ncbi:MAG: type II toxin-antitoxin system YafQ family toxin [Ignavibacteria bacterium]|nr:type II toxin-antitoxin system YafQ family toxin [Ignavibacteria bacterium]MCC7157924.1 type II toxin-antitoxin system YafQ family toxin [Ignavibacteria bacterium]
MIKVIKRTNVFKKDYKKMISRGKNIAKLDNVILELATEQALDSKYKGHKLIGNFKARRECHIEPDWLLIYRKEKYELILERTGSHSDLFE